MAPVARLEVALDLAVEVAQQVEVERRGDAERVVVGGLEHGRGLDEIDADDQAAAARLCTNPAQEGERLLGHEVADAGPGIEEDRASLDEVGRQLEAAREVEAEAD